MKLRVAGAQIPVTKDILTNKKTILRAIEKAAGENADILLTPEGSLSGYAHEFDISLATSAQSAATISGHSVIRTKAWVPRVQLGRSPAR